MVDESSDGRLAYVWIPMGQSGYTYFNRLYFALQAEALRLLETQAVVRQEEPAAPIRWRRPGCPGSHPPGCRICVISSVRS